MSKNEIGKSEISQEKISKKEDIKNTMSTKKNFIPKKNNDKKNKKVFVNSETITTSRKQE